MNLKIGVKSVKEERYVVEMSGLDFNRYKDYTECSIQCYISDLLTTPRPPEDTNLLLELQGLVKYNRVGEVRNNIKELGYEITRRKIPGNEEVYEDYYFLTQEIISSIETLEQLEEF